MNTDSNVTVTASGLGAYTAMLVPDTYEVRVEPMGGSAATHLEERFMNLVVSAAATHDFALTAGVQVSGTILDNVGMPLLEETDVEIVLPEGSRFFAPDDVTSDDNDGTYSIGPVPPGKIWFQFEAPDDSGFPVQQSKRTLSAPTQTADFSLSAGYVLSGTVLRNDGLTAESNVEVSALPANGSLAPDDDDTSGTGSYEISLFPGTYVVTFLPETTNLQLPEAMTVTVTGNMTLDLTLTLGALVTGNVTQPGGLISEPDVRVEIEGVLGASDVTDGSGDYSSRAGRYARADAHADRRTVRGLRDRTGGGRCRRGSGTRDAGRRDGARVDG